MQQAEFRINMTLFEGKSDTLLHARSAEPKFVLGAWFPSDSKSSIPELCLVEAPEIVCLVGLQTHYIKHNGLVASIYYEYLNGAISAPCFPFPSYSNDCTATTTTSCFIVPFSYDPVEPLLLAQWPSS